LFLSFARVSLYGFGGVLPWARRMIVEERRWMTAAEFNDAFALSHFLPGPNIVNFSVVFGARFRGAAGGVVALLGLLGPPVVIVTLLGVLYAKFGDVEALRRVLVGISAAAAGLIVAMVGKMAEPMLRERFLPALGVTAATFAAVGLLRWSLPLVLAAVIPLSIGLAWWRLRHSLRGQGPDGGQ
jgi:chromate transporter